MENTSLNHVISDLEILCGACGVAGQRGITDTIISLLRGLVDDIQVDSMGNILATVCKNDNAPHIMLEAHLDEIGFLVTGIDGQGFIHAAPVGGIDCRVLAAQQVDVYGDAVYHGVFGAIPPHLIKKDDGSVPDIEDFCIDIGMTAQDARDCVPLGSRVSFAASLFRLGDTVVSSKALDDRAGIAAILHCLRLLKDTECHVSAAFCVQEELGNRGAVTAVRQLHPDMALVTDVSFAMTAGEKTRQCGRMSAGAMVGISPVLDADLSQEMLMLAESVGIPSQTEVMGGSTGTDADVISNACAGIPTGLLSIPQRNMHMPVECVDVRDVVAVGELMAQVVWKRGARGE